MTLEKEEQLRNNGNLFQEPDSTLLLSSGCGRHWPDSRGIFHNDSQETVFRFHYNYPQISLNGLRLRLLVM